MGRSFWISLVLVVAVLGGWMVNFNQFTSQLVVANGNAAMYDLAAEVMQFRTQHGQLPDQLAVKYTSSLGSSSNVFEAEDSFAGFRQRWTNVKLADGLLPPANDGLAIIYNPGLNGSFDLMVYEGNRLINQRKYN